MSINKTKEELKLKRKQELEIRLKKSQEVKQMLKTSKKIRTSDKSLTFFFNNSTVSRILDLFLDNPQMPIFTTDLMEKGDISRKSLYSNTRILMAFGAVSEIEKGKKKFYKWNNDNVLAKHISKLRHIINSDNVRLSE